MIVTCFLAAYKAGTLGRRRDFSCFNRIFDGPFSWFLIGIFLPMTVRCCAAILSSLQGLLISLMCQFTFIGFLILTSCYVSFFRTYVSGACGMTFFGGYVSKNCFTTFFRKTISFLGLHITILTPASMTIFAALIFVEFAQRLNLLASAASFAYDLLSHDFSPFKKSCRLEPGEVRPSFGSFNYSGILARGQL